MRAVVWWHQATDAAAATLPPILRAAPHLRVTVAAFVDYTETPVGAYREVLASPVVLLTPLPTVTVPFIAVDSAASIAGGRANWALPKTPARFDGHAGAGMLVARGDGWTVEGRVRSRGPALPLAVRAAARQVGPDDAVLHTAVRGLGRARLGRVAVRATGPDAPRWLREGDHPCLVVQDARVWFPEPRRLGAPAASRVSPRRPRPAGRWPGG